MSPDSNQNGGGNKWYSVTQRNLENEEMWEANKRAKRRTYKTYKKYNADEPKKQEVVTADRLFKKVLIAGRLSGALSMPYDTVIPKNVNMLSLLP
uniref:Uncharacterized protein n=1 Tax=Ascaris lumbricoides TaxID=6252 RepID=A0A0M3IN56_ASCLU